MDINLLMLAERRDAYKQQKDQAWANFNALAGAIEDCEYWMRVLENQGAKQSNGPSAGPINLSDITEAEIVPA